MAMEIKFNVTLKNLIKQKGVSLSALARYLNITRQAVSYYCNGEVTPSYTLLLKIAEYFDVSTDYLLTGIEPQDKKEQKNLNLSSTTIRLLKACKPEIMTLIDTFLSDSEFYFTLSNALDSMNFYGDYLFRSFKEKNITEFNTTHIKDSDRQPIGTSRAIRKAEINTYEQMLENARLIGSQEIGSYFSDVLSENSEMKKARDFFYGKFE